jgi:hypothetical protein
MRWIMRRAALLAPLLAVPALLALPAVAAHASSPWNPATCTATENAAGDLYVTGAGLTASYTYGADIYDVQPGGYSPEVSADTVTTDASGNFTYTSPQTVAYYLGLYPGTTTLEFYAERHWGSQTAVIAACSYP